MKWVFLFNFSYMNCSYYFVLKACNDTICMEGRAYMTAAGYEESGIMNYKKYMNVVLLVFFVVSVIYSQTIPVWQNSDEPFHYYYIASLLYDHKLPDQETTYQSTHPPMYYMMAAVWTLPFKNKPIEFRLFWIRLLSAVMGTISVYYIYLFGKEAFDSGWIGAAMASLAVINPMFVCASAVCNNDIGVIMACSIALFLMINLLKNGGNKKTAAICGLAAGICCLFKITASYLPPFFIFLYVFHSSNRGRKLFDIIGELIIFVIFFSLVCGWWYIIGYMNIGDLILFNRPAGLYPTPLYVPSNFIWFTKSMMMTFWLPHDYLRGQPAAAPMVLKLLYVSLSAIIIFLSGFCLFRTRNKLSISHRHMINCCFAGLMIYLTQEAIHNMSLPTAQARYMFHMYGLLAAVVVLPISGIKECTLVKGVIGVTVAGIVLHLIWAFVYFLPCLPPPFVVT